MNHSSVNYKFQIDYHRHSVRTFWESFITNIYLGSEFLGGDVPVYPLSIYSASVLQDRTEGLFGDIKNFYPFRKLLCESSVMSTI